jgi:hypothetical protein
MNAIVSSEGELSAEGLPILITLMADTLVWILL